MRIKVLILFMAMFVCCEVFAACPPYTGSHTNMTTNYGCGYGNTGYDSCVVLSLRNGTVSFQHGSAEPQYRDCQQAANENGITCGGAGMWWLYYNGIKTSDGRKVCRFQCKGNADGCTRYFSIRKVSGTPGKCGTANNVTFAHSASSYVYSV